MALLFIWTKPRSFCSAIITDANDDPPRREYRNCEKDRAFSATSATCPGNLDDLELNAIAKLFFESLVSRPFREDPSIFDGCKCYESDGRDGLYETLHSYADMKYS